MSTLAGFTSELIDYAGLFPPAGWEMPVVVKNYAEYLKGPKRDMLARLIVPAARLAEFEKAAADLLPKKNPWRISALVPSLQEDQSDFKFAISGIAQFNKRHADPLNGLAVVDVIEIKTPTIDHIRRTIDQLPQELSAFLEISHQEDPTESIQLVAETERRHRFFAKIRTGGVTPDLIPSCAEVARFLHACAEQLVGFKATAGLHHPIRDEFNLTYEADSPRGTMHGFVNVFVAACLAFGCSISLEEVEAILKCESADAFSFHDDQLRWDNYALSAAKVARLRKEFAISFGSCSFTEPTFELEQTGIGSQTIKSTN